jgi:hypothetical protein
VTSLDSTFTLIYNANATAIIAYPFHPKRLKDKHPPLMTDLIHLEITGHHDCVSQIIAMIADLKEQGTNSRFLKAFSGGILELKSRARGGDKGGARVYLFRISQNASKAMLPTPHCWRTPPKSLLDTKP